MKILFRITGKQNVLQSSGRKDFEFPSTPFTFHHDISNIPKSDDPFETPQNRPVGWNQTCDEYQWSWKAHTI